MDDDKIIPLPPSRRPRLLPSPDEAARLAFHREFADADMRGRARERLDVLTDYAHARRIKGWRGFLIRLIVPHLLTEGVALAAYMIGQGPAPQSIRRNNNA